MTSGSPSREVGSGGLPDHSIFSSAIYQHRTRLFLTQLRENCFDLALSEFFGDDPERVNYLPNASIQMPPGPTHQATGVDRLNVRRGYEPPMYDGFPTFGPDFLEAKYLSSRSPRVICESRTNDVDPDLIAEELRRVLTPVAEMSASIVDDGYVQAWRVFAFSDATPGFVSLSQSFSEAHGRFAPVTNLEIRLSADFPVPPSGSQTLAGVIRAGAADMDESLRDLVVQDAALTERDWRARLTGQVQREDAETAVLRETLRRELDRKVEAQRRASGTTTSQMIAQGIQQGMGDFVRQEQTFAATDRAISPSGLERALDAPPPSGRDGHRDGDGTDANGLTLRTCASGIVEPSAGMTGTSPYVAWSCDGRFRSEAEARAYLQRQAADRAAYEGREKAKRRERERTSASRSTILPDPCPNAAPGAPCNVEK